MDTGNTNAAMSLPADDGGSNRGWGPRRLGPANALKGAPVGLADELGTKVRRSRTSKKLLSIGPEQQKLDLLLTSLRGPLRGGGRRLWEFSLEGGKSSLSS